MEADPGEVERWHFGGRYYGVTMASTPDTMDLELDDLGPAPSHGLVIAASMSDATGDVTVRVFSEMPLPIALVQQFLSEAECRLPPTR